MEGMGRFDASAVLYPGTETPNTSWIGGEEDRIASLDVVKKKRIPVDPFEHISYFTG
jgi:hypothetical protein